MQIYIVKVKIKNEGVVTNSYIDSVWQNKEDAVEHIKKCHAECIFNTQYEPQIVEETLIPHIE